MSAPQTERDRRNVMADWLEKQAADLLLRYPTATLNGWDHEIFRDYLRFLMAANMVRYSVRT